MLAARPFSTSLAFFFVVPRAVILAAPNTHLPGQIEAANVRPGGTSSREVVPSLSAFVAPVTAAGQRRRGSAPVQS